MDNSRDYISNNINKPKPSLKQSVNDNQQTRNKSSSHLHSTAYKNNRSYVSNNSGISSPIPDSTKGRKNISSTPSNQIQYKRDRKYKDTNISNSNISNSNLSNLSRDVSKDNNRTSMIESKDKYRPKSSLTKNKDRNEYIPITSEQNIDSTFTHYKKKDKDNIESKIMFDKTFGKQGDLGNQLKSSNTDKYSNIQHKNPTPQFNPHSSQMSQKSYLSQYKQNIDVITENKIPKHNFTNSYNENSMQFSKQSNLEISSHVNHEAILSTESSKKRFSEGLINKVNSISSNPSINKSNYETKDSFIKSHNESGLFKVGKETSESHKFKINTTNTHSTTSMDEAKLLSNKNIESIEELHLKIVNILQSSKNIMRAQEVSNEKENPYQTVTKFDEKDI